MHRDIKPANIYLCRYARRSDFVKVLDFGLAKHHSGAMGSGGELLTQVGSFTGTPACMAPEMAPGTENVDGRADLYCLGCVAYWLLTGKLVFDEESLMATVIAHASVAPIPPGRRSELEVPTDLENLVLRCLAKSADDRPQSAGELLRQVDSICLTETWTQDRADRWWQLHSPAVLD